MVYSTLEMVQTCVSFYHQVCQVPPRLVPHSRSRQAVVMDLAENLSLSLHEQILI